MNDTLNATGADEAPPQQEVRAQELLNMASFVRGLTDTAAEALTYVGTTINVYVGHHANPVELMVAWAQEGVEHGLTVTRFVRDEYANVVLEFGIATFHVYAGKDHVCPRVGAAPDAPREWPDGLKDLPFDRVHVRSE